LSGICLANSAIRCCFVETLVGSEAPGICHSNGSVFRQPLGSSGSLGSVPRLHRYFELLRLPVARPGALPFRSFAGTAPCQSFAPEGVGPLPRAGVLWVVVSPTTLLMAETTGSPRFLGSPNAPCPARRPRRGPRVRPLRPLDAAFRTIESVGPHIADFEAQSHGLVAPCVRFVAWVTPVLSRHATLGSGCWPALPGGVGYPLGTIARFQDFAMSSFLLAQAWPGAPIALWIGPGNLDAGQDPAEPSSPITRSSSSMIPSAR